MTIEHDTVRGLVRQRSEEIGAEKRRQGSCRVCQDLDTPTESRRKRNCLLDHILTVRTAKQIRKPWVAAKRLTDRRRRGTLVAIGQRRRSGTGRQHAPSRTRNQAVLEAGTFDERIECMRIDRCPAEGLTRSRDLRSDRCREDCLRQPGSGRSLRQEALLGLTARRRLRIGEHVPENAKQHCRDCGRQHENGPRTPRRAAASAQQHSWQRPTDRVGACGRR